MRDLADAQVRGVGVDFIPDVSITELVFRGLAGRESEPALIDGVTGHVLTGAGFRERVERLAGGLAARGIGPGRVAALLAPNAPDWCAAFHAVAWAGGTVTTLSPLATAAEVAGQLRDSGAVLLVTVPELSAAREGAAAAGVAAVPVEALTGAPLRAQVAVDPARDVAAMPYSSGTTGAPKGVRLTHRNLVANVVQVRAALALRPGDATLAFLPYFHVYGMTMLMNLYLAAGGVQVTLPRFELVAALGLIERHRVRQLYAVPPVVMALARDPAVEGYDLSSLMFVNSGAAPLGAGVAEACAARIGCEVIQGYGMTEMSPVSHITPPGRNRAGTSGQPLAGTECRLVDPGTGTEVAPGEAGELQVRGPQVMAGYHGRPEATAAALAPGGWLRTGDLAEIDGEGYLTVLGRVDEVIRVDGREVAPAEIEAVLLTHPAVADVAVAGEDLRAFVVATAGAVPELGALQRHLAAHLPAHKRIGALEVVAGIPKSASGKILRRLLPG